MKIIHTSDWHVGREFEGESLAEYQMAFIAWLCDQVRAHDVDLVIVAGDVYDKSMPKGEAVTLLDGAINDLQEASATVVLISGNHDNAARLNFGARRQRGSGLYIEARDTERPVPFVVECSGESVAILAIPFLDPQRAPDPRSLDEGARRPRTHQNVLEEAIDCGRDQLEALGSMPVIAVAHAYVLGSEISDSERHTVGGSDAVDARIFEGFSYVALGHIHRPQEIGGNHSIAYSGSPLPYSFSEEHGKSVRLLDLSPDGDVSVSLLSIPVGRPVKVLTDTFANLLNSDEYEPFVGYWISAKLTDEGVIEEPMARLRERYPHIAALAYAEVRRGGASGPIEGAIDIDKKSSTDSINEFITDLQGREPNDYETALIDRGMSLLQRDED